jgi:hypothetical protein
MAASRRRDIEIGIKVKRKTLKVFYGGATQTKRALFF